jgi:pimeloyl-ACP methyl ester carboxylesterase
MNAIPSRQGHSPEVASRIENGQNQTRFVKTVFSELVSSNESAAQLQNAAPLDDLPIVVLMAGTNHDNEEERLQNLERHQGFCELSSPCEFLIAEDSGHRIHEEDPDAVVNAIRRAIELLESN